MDQYSEIALTRKTFGTGHMYLYTVLFRMTDTMTSLNIDLPSWDTVCIDVVSGFKEGRQSRLDWKLCI
jgi:hypothetical protein